MRKTKTRQKLWDAWSKILTDILRFAQPQHIVHCDLKGVGLHAVLLSALIKQRLLFKRNNVQRSCQTIERRTKAASNNWAIRVNPGTLEANWQRGDSRMSSTCDAEKAKPTSYLMASCLIRKRRSHDIFPWNMLKSVICHWTKGLPSSVQLLEMRAKFLLVLRKVWLRFTYWINVSHLSFGSLLPQR